MSPSNRPGTVPPMPPPTADGSAGLKCKTSALLFFLYRTKQQCECVHVKKDLNWHFSTSQTYHILCVLCGTNLIKWCQWDHLLEGIVKSAFGRPRRGTISATSWRSWQARSALSSRRSDCAQKRQQNPRWNWHRGPIPCRCCCCQCRRRRNEEKYVYSRHAPAASVSLTPPSSSLPVWRQGGASAPAAR